MSREDVMYTPVWERRNYIQQLLDEVEEERKQMENQQSKSYSSGKRT